MNIQSYVFTSESVAEGHPDKLCDKISDALVDAALHQNPRSRLGIECMATQGHLFIAGETAGYTFKNEEIERIARQVIKEIGYEALGFDWRTVNIHNQLQQQSADIARGIDQHSPHLQGAGDQGIMFGYACAETETYMPAPIYYAHRLLKNITIAKKAGEIGGVGPDGKAQVSLSYLGNQPIKVETLILSIQHSEDLTSEQLYEMMLPYIHKTFPKGWLSNTIIHINPTGRFVIGGPGADCGLTGRKVIVDTYGGAAPHGGGAFSGKDPSKVDRSASYMARYIAKNIVAAGVASKCTLQLSYSIGLSQPMSIFVNTHGTQSILPDSELVKYLNQEIDFSPWGITESLRLERPIYERTSSYGHFGWPADREGGYSWENTDLINKFAKLL